ncbi:MAG: elongation factor G [Alphaproteobacteria bacterium]|nr:elongation factor G [Alphaproteobacteria bacterium]
MGERKPAAPRCAALIGPYLSGKTTLLESLLHATEATQRRGSVKDGTTVGDASAEARARQMSTEINVAHTSYLGDPWTFIDCPGSVELANEARAALLVADTAVVVCEPDIDKAVMLAPLLKFLDDNRIPHMLFVNKVDVATTRVRDLMEALQAVSQRPLVLRQIPIRRDGDDADVTGYIDLVSERAYAYKPGQPSELIAMPETARERELSERQKLLERLADFDDALLEQLLSDALPAKAEIYQQLTKDLERDLIVPVFLGAAERDHGVRRLLKALRHEVPEPARTADRKGLEATGEPLAQVFKTMHAAHTGKLSLARVWRGTITEGMVLNDVRVGGIVKLLGAQQQKVASAGIGDVVGLGRMDPIVTGTVLTPSGKGDPALDWPAAPAPVYRLAIHAEKRADEVKLTGALARLAEEDPALSAAFHEDTHELVLSGQGDIHLQIAADRLRNRYNVPVTVRPPQVPFKETIRRGTSIHSRFKRQSGGHGQFADIHVDIKPLPRGSGFAFAETVVGGVVPKQYIPSVEEGVREYLKQGPLGFPVVDVSVTLTSGQFHAVDSSDMAFKTAGRQAMVDGMPACEPVLLEPILHVAIAAPSAYTSKVQRLVTGRRGQVLGYDARDGWEGWDVVTALIPQTDTHDLIIELRSLTHGIGSFTARFDHLQELTGRLADKVVESRAAAAAQ